MASLANDRCAISKQFIKKHIMGKYKSARRRVGTQYTLCCGNMHPFLYHKHLNPEQITLCVKPRRTVKHLILKPVKHFKEKKTYCISGPNCPPWSLAYNKLVLELEG